MRNVQIELRTPPRWVHEDGTYVCGAAFEGQELKQGQMLCEHFSHAHSEGEFIAAVKALNGFFAVVHEHDGRLIAAVDRLRSIPLFYGVKNDHFYLSDDAEWVKERVGDTERDELAETEFLLTGYVTGRDTLYPHVKQLQAGEALIVSVSSGKLLVRTERYYRYMHTDEFAADEDALLRMLDQVMVNCIERLMAWANGRTIVIPLSGGYDSRLIALMLKRLGYERLVAFSYGRSGNREARISQQVARELGIPWEFVPYSNKEWWDWFHSVEQEEYHRFAHGLVSLPHLQDWPAVWNLKERGKLPEDAVFVPGHAANVPTGDHIPPSFLRKSQVGTRQFVEEVLSKHYSFWDWKRYGRSFVPVLQERIVTLSEAGSFGHPELAIDAFEKWEWQERQAKYITNSVRVYEFWGYEWWLPFWDAEFMGFWNRIPLRFRRGARLYHRYVDKEYAAVSQTNHHRGTTRIRLLMTSVEQVLRVRMQNLVLTLLAKAFPRIKAHIIYKRHPLAVYGALSKSFLLRHYTGRENRGSFLVMRILKKMDF